MTWHQFRHIHSSLLNNLNVPVKIAQEQLGHSSMSTTLDIYTPAFIAVDVVDPVRNRLATGWALDQEVMDPHPLRRLCGAPSSHFPTSP